MSFPREIAAALGSTKITPVGGGFFALKDETCAGAKFHSPQPLVLRKVKVMGQNVLLCGICADNLRTYQDLLKAHDGEMPWEVRRAFGNQIRSLAAGKYDNGR